ncbi:MAG: ubiquinone/menaquinone biosynthesis C-methylase UbiE [Oleiphilaceae bacterium]|jgi:ubiquinone/menaquinone biosynthesis C-methylase UbiE
MKIGLFFTCFYSEKKIFMSDYWSQYWQQGYLTSFGQDIQGNYTGELKACWEQFFASLTPNSQILDVGTGNGAIIKLGLNPERKTDFIFHGVDSAKLAVSKDLLDNPNIQFYPEVNVESLPFKDHQYQAVVSQFALEYIKLEPAIAQLSRVLCKQGQFQFVIHDISSIIVMPNVNILMSAQRLAAPDGCFTLLKMLLNKLAKKDDAEAGKIRTQLNEKMGREMTDDSQSLSATNFPQLIKAVFAKGVSEEQRQKYIEFFAQELIGQTERLTDLAEAALDDQKKQTLMFLLDQYGLVVKLTKQIIDGNGNLIAHCVSGVKV